jgi:D-3-phosphoglycerate dehydrogenase
MVAVTFAKEEPQGFNRCSFPVVGRPVMAYPLLAAAHARGIYRNFLSTGSERLIHVAQSIPQVEILRRTGEHVHILEEFAEATRRIIERLGGTPRYMVFLYGNSPCILSQMIESAVAALEARPQIDSAVTVTRRPEFRPSYSFAMEDSGFLRPHTFVENDPYRFFLDARLIVVRPEIVLGVRPPLGHFNQILGRAIYPILQEDGMGDIDYAWQVPLVERWLRSNGFTEKEMPYAAAAEAGAQAPAEVPPKAVGGQRRILITTVPFGSPDPRPIELLRNERRCRFTINPIGRKLKEFELREMVRPYEILIAGTEPITRAVMENAPGLRLISRVGIGLDNVDLAYARERGILVSYTPDSPAPAVAELTIGHMLNLMRSLSLADRRMREGVWQRIMGHRLANQTIGIIGTGRIGSRVLKHLQGFAPKRILVNDISPDPHLYAVYHAEPVAKETIYREADIITLHVPLTDQTRDLITRRELAMMKPTAILVNTSRGGIMNERDVYEALAAKRIGGAALDVFQNEPYAGELTALDNSSLTCHMGSCTIDCRSEMERIATEEALRFVHGEPLENLVPESEYPRPA